MVPRVFANRGSSHRRKGAASHAVSDMVWLYRSQLLVGSRGPFKDEDYLPSQSLEGMGEPAPFDREVQGVEDGWMWLRRIR